MYGLFLVSCSLCLAYRWLWCLLIDDCCMLVVERWCVLVVVAKCKFVVVRCL